LYIWCSREILPAAAAQPAKVRQSCSATDLFLFYFKKLSLYLNAFITFFQLTEIYDNLLFADLIIMHTPATNNHEIEIFRKRKHWREW
jgi:hypothetical protein